MHPLLNILFRATLALLVSALILFAVFVAYIEADGSHDTGRIQAIDIPGSGLQIVIGSAEPRGEQLVITRFEPRAGEYHSIAVWRGEFQAVNYPLLRYQLDAAQLPLRVQLLWMTEENPEGFFILDLANAVGDPGWLDLSKLPNWQGTVVEVGVLVFVSSPDKELSISRLTFTPPGWRAVLASHWYHWSSFRGWSGRSINVLPGTTDSGGISPVPVVAAWAALAAILLVIARLVGGKIHAGALAAVLLLPWVSLDLLWQKELSTQLQSTKDQFADKSVHERHLAAHDSSIYQYVLRLKKEVLPEEPARILLLHDSEGHTYQRLKTQYYLLPHNVYNLGKLPPNYGFPGIDHIIVLGDVPGLEYHRDTSTLVWNGGAMVIAVELLDSDPQGSVYRIANERRRPRDD